MHKWTLSAEMLKSVDFDYIGVKVLKKRQDLQNSSFLTIVDSRFYTATTQVAIFVQQPGLYIVFVQILANGRRVLNTTNATLRVTKGRQYARQHNVNPAKFPCVSFCQSSHNTPTFSS